MATDSAGGIGRRDLLRAIVIGVATAAVLLLVYYLLPSQPAHGSAALRLLIGGGLVVVVLAHELRAILRHDRPVARSVVALGVVVPLFVVVFAWTYLTLSRTDPSSFGTPLDRTGALYFTVTILSTVGFGDITPKTDEARLLVTTQMVADVVLIAVAVRLIFEAARRSSRARAEGGEDE